MPPVELCEPKRILVVDDERPETLLAVLQERGFAAHFAHDASRALRLVGDGDVDLVVVDIEDPAAGGQDLLRQIHELSGDVDVVVAMSEAAPRVALEAIREGASDYLTKPFDFDEVEIVLARTLEKRRLIRENEAYREGLEDEVARRTRELVEKRREIEGLYRRLKESSEDTLQTLVSALDLRDNETYGHSWRVAEYAVLTARRIGLSEEDLEAVRWGAILHDVGKIGIPDAILRKRGTLDEDERREMRKHPEMGYGMLRHMSSAKAGLDIVLSHHERWDGSGYPHGLGGEEIPIGARIFAVVDTLDAITSDRPYRPAMPLATARQEVQKHSGTQFDPAIAEVVLSIEDRIWNETRERVDSRVQKRIFLPRSQEPEE